MEEDYYSQEEVSSYWGKDVDVDIVQELQSPNHEHDDREEEKLSLSPHPSPSPPIGMQDDDKTDAVAATMINDELPMTIVSDDDDGESASETRMEFGVVVGSDGGQIDGSQDGVIAFNNNETSNIKTNRGKIQAIDSSVVHQICSGQVIVTLSTAVKELVENALDAGATSIEVRLVEYGAEVIEVIDNGDGVSESNFQGLVLKHHTSKISQFEDLTHIATFGFRGEALSSLAALSNLTINTRTENAKTGFRLEYDSSGCLIGQNPIAREKGTTVCLKRLFSPLPVRHREFIRNLKREFHKMINVLYGYCLISKGVRIMVHHKHGNGSFAPIISIPSTKGLRERIVGVFGSKQLGTLLELQQEDIIDEDTLAEFGLSGNTFINDRFRIEGFISKPNQGRGSNDRQFFYINSRPCDIPKISKIVNQVFNNFSRNQYPFLVLNILTNQHSVDINVTPDKRSLYLQSEKSLYALIKASLMSLYTFESSSFSSQTSSINFEQSQLQFSQESFSGSPRNILTPTRNENDTYFDAQFSTNYRPESTSSSSKRRDKSSIVRSSSSSSCLSSLKERFSKGSSSRFGSSTSNTVNKSSGNSTQKTSVSGWITPRYPARLDKKAGQSIQLLGRHNINDSDEIDKTKKTAFDNDINVDIKSFAFPLSPHANDDSLEEDDEDNPNIRIVYDDELSDYDENWEQQPRPSVLLHVDWEQIKQTCKNRSDSANHDSNKSYAQKFHAKISPGENDVAEQELKKQLTKDLFSQMEILGQFNLGFVLVKLGSDLFIVDQHASDEKYNFEHLQKFTVLQTQRLILPMELELPSLSENIVMDHLDTFRKNGFDFDINPNANPTERVKLSKIPFSKSCEFGKSDVEELIFMLEDCDEPCFCRPSKIRDMFASRACRKSVMIGNSLGATEMRKIVDHMGTMDQPWNCPHGRPTIRHLFNTSLLPDNGTQPHLHSH